MKKKAEETQLDLRGPVANTLPTFLPKLSMAFGDPYSAGFKVAT